MSTISSIQTIAQATHQVTGAQLQDNTIAIPHHPMSYQQSLTIDNESSIPLEAVRIEGQKIEDTNVTTKLIQGITEIDSDYQSIMGRLNTWPDFNGYLEKRGVSEESKLEPNIGITHISNIDDIAKATETNEPMTNLELLDEKSQKVEALQKEQQAYYAAGLEYSKDSTLWSMNSTFWLSKIKILTSAVSEVSRGFKTLFMSQ